MRIAFVVQRYGLEVNGGAELEARQIAEHVAPFVQVEVLTTCALDYMSWENYYSPGVTLINGVSVRRFPVVRQRDVVAFNELSARLVRRPHSYYDEIDWMALQGPDAPELFNFLRDHHGRYDLVLFFTYLYATSFVGLHLVPFKGLLFPTAHDEIWIYFDIFRSLFNLPRGFVFNSEEECEFVRNRFQNKHIPGAVLGVGIELPAVPATEVLPEPYVLYLGRIDESKGCKELIQYFVRYKDQSHDPVKLVLIGAEVMRLPRHPDIISLGFMKEERFAWLKQAELLVLPSANESLSLATLEAWALGVPVLVNGAAAVLKGHCDKSRGGLYYLTEKEFAAGLGALRSDPVLRSRLGANGKAYVEGNYSWESITPKYVAFFREMYDIVGQPAQPGTARRVDG